MKRDYDDGLLSYSKKLALLTLIFFATNVVYANPQLDNIAAGNVLISQTSSTTQIQQSSQQAIINWKSFNIGAQEKTQFVQPNASAIALNRISPSQGASQIYGSLIANGRIILVNGAGIYFGPSAYVNVGGIIASTSNISDANFLNGNYVFDQPSSSGSSIINEGRIISAAHGLVALIGSNVTNNGMISARLGSIVLGAANKFTLDFNGDQLINFTVDEAASNGGTVTNTGKLLANGGQVLVTARQAQGVLDNAINMGGVVEAKSVHQKNGVIILDSGSGNILVTGKLIATGKHHNNIGGTVKVLGNNVHLASTAKIDVSGALGGGEIFIGGNEHGVGAEQNALTTTVDAGVTLTADALVNGNGGKIIVWSNNDTQFHGSVSAQGGTQSGNGGFVETSGHYLDVSGINLNLRATKGKTGSWLLDPADLTICTACTTDAVSSNNTYSSNTNSTLLVDDLIAALANANITVLTSASGSGGNGDIFVDTPITWSSGNSLTLSAYRNITVAANASITNTGTGSASVVLNADNTGTGVGTVSFDPTSIVDVTTNGGSGSVTIYYNPVTFGTQDTMYTGGTTPTAYMLINQLGAETDTTTPSLASLSNNSSLWGENYALAKNIDASATTGWGGGNGFTPIANGASYSGNFDGRNFTISNYFSAQNGLFYNSSGTIQNLKLASPTLTLSGGSGDIGSLIGTNSGAATNISVSNLSFTVNGGSFSNIGGLIGNNYGTLNNDSISNLSLILNNGASASKVGGLVGVDGYYDFSHGFVYTGYIYNSFVTGSVTNNGSVSGALSLFLGEINSAGALQNDYAIGSLINNPSSIGNGTQIGLLIGQDSDSFGNILTDSYAIGSISNTDVDGSEVIGGLIGFNYSKLQNSFAIVNITSQDTGNNASETIGGLEGWAYGGPVADDYALGSIINNTPNSGSLVMIGGVAGRLSAQITTTYSAVAISNQSLTSPTIGGITSNTGADLSTDIFDTDFSGISSQSGTNTNEGCFSGSCVNGGTLAMNAQQTFVNLGFDFTNTWGIVEGESYPYLLALNTSTPRAISGKTGLTSGTVTLAANGSALVTSSTNSGVSQGTAAIGANGFYYFLEGNGVLSDGTTIASYLPGTGGAAITTVSGTNSITGLNITANTVSIGSDSAGQASNTGLAGLSSLLSQYYSASGSNLTFANGIGLTTSANTQYDMDGNITAGGNVLFNGAVLIGANVTLDSGSNAINFASTIDSAATNYSLTLTSTAGITLNGNIGGTTPLASLTISNGSLTFGSSLTAINTVNDQLYNSNVTLSGDVTLTSSAGHITLNGVDGASDNLTLVGGTGNLFTLNSTVNPFNLNNLTITGGSGATLNANASSALTWTISGTDSGIVTGFSNITGSFSFSSIANLTGSNSSNNTFVLNDNATISGITDGGNSSGLNTLDYSAYTTYAQETLTSASSGTLKNDSNAIIVTFTNIQGWNENSAGPPPSTPAPPVTPTPSTTTDNSTTTVTSSPPVLAAETANTVVNTVASATAATQSFTTTTQSTTSQTGPDSSYTLLPQISLPIITVNQSLNNITESQNNLDIQINSHTHIYTNCS